MHKKAGVIGHPIDHSLSPKIHQFWLEKYAVEGSYEAIDVAPEALEEFVKTAAQNEFVGFNVTIPHKESIVPLLDDIHLAAAAIGAVNTVVIEDGKTFGYNTDAQGFITNIQETFPELDMFETTAVILGAGGAARAACYALIEEGVHVVICNRTQERAEKLKQDMEHLMADTYPEITENNMISVQDWENRSNILADISLLVNATSLGMQGNEELDIDLSGLSKDAVVTDIVYAPLKTTLLEKAEAQGNATIDGIGMLLYQAEPGFYAWFGKRPEVSEELRQHIVTLA